MIQTMPRKHSKEAILELKAIFKARNMKEAKALKDQFITK